ncbi:MAG: hypothetical protein GY716_22485 [bacterium]|nr:hypothetical protein [bacterium]
MSNKPISGRKRTPSSYPALAILIPLVFVAFGVYRLISVWRPEGSQWIVPLVFIGLGLVQLRSTVRSHSKASSSAVEPRIDAGDTEQFSVRLPGWILAPCIAAGAFGLFWGIKIQWSTPATVLGVVVSAAAPVLAFMLLGRLRAVPRLRLSVTSVRLGETLELSWEVDEQMIQPGRLSVTLVGTGKARSEKGSSTSTWSHEFCSRPIVEKQDRHSIRRGRTAIAIPRDFMHSFEGSSNEIFWTIRVKSDAPWLPDLTQDARITIRPRAIQEIAP